MCIRDRVDIVFSLQRDWRGDGVELEVLDIAPAFEQRPLESCLLYTSDAADERSSVDLGGRRIIKKKKKAKH